MSEKRGVKHSPAMREQRRALIARLTLKYRDRRDIAKKLAEIEPGLAVSASMVGYDIRIIERLWKKVYVEAIQTQKSKELQELLELRQTTWECLERSIGKSRTITKEGKQGTDGKVKDPKVVIKEEELAGNPSLVAQLIDINKQIRILMGLDDPQKFELAGRDGGPISAEIIGINYGEFARAFSSIANGKPDLGSMEAFTRDSNSKSVDSAATEDAGISLDKASDLPSSPL
jgi:hypothetical protein